jgi:membrane-associated HD superfamily phosphohydrolase
LSLKNLCAKCPKRDTCTELCEKAEKYAEQDHVSQRESCKPEYIFELLNMHVKAQHIDEVLGNLNENKIDFPFLTAMQNQCIYYFYFEGLSYSKIAQNLRIKTDRVSYQLRSAKKKLLDFISTKSRDEIKNDPRQKEYSKNENIEQEFFDEIAKIKISMSDTLKKGGSSKSFPNENYDYSTDDNDHFQYRQDILD